MMPTATVGQQVKALLVRNVLIKKRSRCTLISEILLPIFGISLVAILSAVIPITSEPEVSSIPAYPASLFLSTVNKTLIVSPNSSEILQVMDKAVSTLSIAAADKYEVFDTEKEGLDAIAAHENRYSLAVIFESTTPVSGTPGYKIRVAYNKTPDGNKTWEAGSACRTGVVDPDKTDGLAVVGCPANQYLYNGFFLLQAAVDYALIAVKTGLASFPVPEVSVQMLPIPEFDQSYNWLQGMLVVFMPMIYLPLFTPMVTFLVSEKEKKIKSSLQMMGMKDISFWVSWAVIYWVITLLMTFIISGIMFGANIFRNSNYGVLFILMLLAGWALLAFIMMLSVFFRHPQVAAICVTLLVLLIAAINYAIQIPRGGGNPTEPWAQWLLCLLPPAAMVLGIDQAAYLDFNQGGAHGSTLMHTDDLYNFPLGFTLLMLALDIVLYSLLGFYLDSVCPFGRDGRALSCCFCCSGSFWRDADHQDKDYTDLRQKGEQVEDIEPVSPELKDKEAIRIINLKKQFPNGKYVPSDNWCGRYCGAKEQELSWAVNGVTLDLYEGHITALLGHNGAGKSTLINMVTGLLEPTEGTATIYNQDILDFGDVARIRSMVGICPQHDTLFEDISVWEHLRLVANLRGILPEMIDSKIEEIISLIDLSTQVHTFAKNLSGGQKRKLSMGIALMGDPKVLFLDEPTAGMDPYSRRKMWTLLQKIKKDRAILLTTHFMDEADILADRKAILTKGKLRCCGSSLYLKNKFGIGYHLNIVVEPESQVEAITDFIVSHVEGATLSREHGRELAYILPANKTNQFPILFAALEDIDGANANSLGISNYGISMPTLEEVFLKLGEEPQGDEEETDHVPLDKVLEAKMNDNQYASNRQLVGNMENVNEDSLATGPLTEEEMNEPLDLPKQQFRALFKARWILMGREPWVPVVRIVVPMILVVGGLMMLLFITDSFDYQDPPENNFNTWSSYQNDLVFLYQNNTGTSIDDVLGGLASELNGIGYEAIQNTSNILQQGPKLAGFGVDKFITTASGIDSKVTLMYNQSAVHSLPMMLNAWSNALYGLTSSPDSAWKINVTSQALPELNPKPDFSNRIFNAIRIIGLGLAMLCGWYGYEVLQDRQRNTRGQLRVSGLTAKTYWAVFLSQHSLFVVVLTLVCIIIMVSVGIPEFSPPGAILCAFLLVIFYCPMMLAFSYASSFLFSRPESYASASINASSLVGFVMYVGVSILQPINSTASLVLHYLFMVTVPYYHIYGGLHFIAMVYQDKLIIGEQDQISVGDYFRPENTVLFTLILILLHFLLWTFVLRVLEVKSTGGDAKEAFCGTKKKNSIRASRENTDCIHNEDVDVAQERQRVEHLDPYAQAKGAPVVVVKNLRKEFSKRSGRSCDCCGQRDPKRVKVAVRNLTFAVSPGEVFGLLGHNGAGKTTCLMTVTAEHAPTKGKITVAGYDVNSSLSDAFVYLGTCAQHDRLFDRLTTKEHLELYAAIGGVPPRHIPQTSEYYLKALKIEEHADKKAMDLSGGTKRKLSFAMAMMGKPKIVLLDEPSTGMDPTSKRFLWDTITASFKGNRGAILTTHYMEEADALCNRVGIMVGGELKCLGPTQHLKERFGEGYLLEIKIGQSGVEINSDDRANNLDDFVKEHFPEARQLEMFGDRAQYKIPQHGIRSLATTFAALEKGKQDIDIEEYSFSQSTLEQVFIEFTRSEYETEEEVRMHKHNNEAIV